MKFSKGNMQGAIAITHTCGYSLRHSQPAPFLRTKLETITQIRLIICAHDTHTHQDYVLGDR